MLADRPEILSITYTWSNMTLEKVEDLWFYVASGCCSTVVDDYRLLGFCTIIISKHNFTIG